MQANRLLATLALLLTLAAAQPSFAETVGGSIPLTVSNSDITFSMSFSTGGADTAHPEASGQLVAHIEWDEQTLEPNYFRIVQEGTLSIDNFHLKIDSNLNPPNSAPLDAKWIFAFNGLWVSIKNGEASGNLLGTSGHLNTKHLDLEITGGEIAMTLEANGQTATETSSYGEASEKVLQNGAPMLRIEKTYSDELRSNYDISLELFFGSESSEYSPELNLRMNGMDRGIITYSAQTEFYTKFGEWALSTGNHFPSKTRGSVSRTGIPIELAYALNLDLRRAYHRKPIVWTIKDGRPTLRLASNALNVDLTIERSSTLASNSWSPIPSAWLLNGEASLKSGSNAFIEVAIPEGEPNVFLRVRPNL